MKIMPEHVRGFFARSDFLDHCVLRPLSHIRGNWETTWNREDERYEPEEESFADKLNTLIEEMSRLQPPARYHDHEDALAERLVARYQWPIRKVGARWIGADYASILENGSPVDGGAQADLMLAATGRVHAAIRFGQIHFDEMEESHRTMLASVLTIILYRRSDEVG